jgi:uncharacterized protein YodC (DUF2158 family)
MYDNVTLISIDNIEGIIFPIKVRRKDGIHITLTKYGQVANADYAKCVIFPKGKTTWEGFVPPCKFKDGDIITDSFGTCIFKGEGEFEGTVDYYCGLSSVCNQFSVKDNKCRPAGHYGFIVNYRLATEEEKQKLFQAIKVNGYKWNPETKTLEKLIEPKFKVGDRIRLKNGGSIIEVTSVNNDGSICVNGMSWTIKIKQQDNYELVPSKFGINTLVPFESRVLVRNVDGDLWKPAIYGFPHSKGCYVVGGVYWGQCIPYEENKELLGTTNNPEEYGSR